MGLYSQKLLGILIRIVIIKETVELECKASEQMRNRLAEQLGGIAEKKMFEQMWLNG